MYSTLITIDNITYPFRDTYTVKFTAAAWSTSEYYTLQLVQLVAPSHAKLRMQGACHTPSWQGGTHTYCAAVGRPLMQLRSMQYRGPPVASGK